MGQCSVGNSERDDGKIWGDWTETLIAAPQSKGAYFNKLSWNFLVRSFFFMGNPFKCSVCTSDTVAHILISKRSNWSHMLCLSLRLAIQWMYCEFVVQYSKFNRCVSWSHVNLACLFFLRMLPPSKKLCSCCVQPVSSSFIKKQHATALTEIDRYAYLFLQQKISSTTAFLFISCSSLVGTGEGLCFLWLLIPALSLLICPICHKWLSDCTV